MTTAVNTLGGINAQSIQAMDLESALMAVQSNRAEQLESQLKAQIGSVQAKNDQIAKLNALLGSLNQAAAQFSADAKADTALSSTGFKNNDYAMEKEINSAAVSAGLTLFPGAAGGRKLDNTTLPGGISGSTTKGQLDGAIQTLKSQIDSMSNSQQMDMLRLQSLSNKRNEAFEIMTNFIKKMQDNRSAILGNMR